MFKIPIKRENLEVKEKKMKMKIEYQTYRLNSGRTEA